MGLVSWGIAYWELESLKLSDKSWVKNITTVHSLLGFVLSLLLVFRTNSAYDRWWEARKQWGALTNTSRNTAIKLNAYLPKEDTKTEILQKSYCPLPTSFILFLRSDYSTFMLDDIQHPELNFDSKHGPNQVASLLYNNVNQLYKDKIITDAQFININQDITDLTNICGACERIKIRQSLILIALSLKIHRSLRYYTSFRFCIFYGLFCNAGRSFYFLYRLLWSLLLKLLRILLVQMQMIYQLKNSLEY